MSNLGYAHPFAISRTDVQNRLNSIFNNRIHLRLNPAYIFANQGGGAYSYVRVLPDEFFLKSVVITVDFKRNSSGRTRIYEYAPSPPINALVTALVSIALEKLSTISQEVKFIIKVSVT